MGKPSAPPAPDYSGAAKATAAGNLDAARQATAANRVNTYTPYGSLTYSQPDAKNNPDQWTSTVSLDPTQQKLLDSQNSSSLQLADMTGRAGNAVDSSFSKPFDYSSVGDVQDASYKAQTARLDPQWDQKQKALETQLANQGITPGSEAYTNSMRDFNSGRNDAYQQATLGAIQTAPQTMQMATSLRDQPLNELNALRTGSQVTNPTFQQAPQQATTQGANMLGAAQATGGYNQGLYNSQVGASNGLMSGLGSIGAGLAGSSAGSAGIMGLFSDIALKEDIKRVGTLDNGVGVYTYRYKSGGPIHMGVMAQELQGINPTAVHTHESGFLMVDYGAI